jgi:PKD repeat protein
MKALKTLAATLATISLTACVVHKAEAPPSLSGPSGAATLISLSAIPDSISQDGGAQSAIRVTAIGSNGKPLAALPLRLDTFVFADAVPRVSMDFGTLSARTIVTNGDGVATVVFTAPPSPPAGFSDTCRGLPGTCVEIVATPIGTSSFDAAAPQSVRIRLVPPGVILPPSSTPTPCFTISPSPVVANNAVQFTAGTLVGGVCEAALSNITTFDWNFGDGSSGSGRIVSHLYDVEGTFRVTITETSDRGLSGSRTQDVQVGPGSLPTAAFTFSPSAPDINQTVFFNASTSTPGAGHSIVSYRWTFGDGAAASGVSVSHAYAAAGSYGVQLTVTDEAGQSNTSGATSVLVGTPTPPAAPTAAFTFSPAAPQAGTPVNFNGSASSSSVVSWQWDFGNGVISGISSIPTTTQVFAAGTWNVTLIVRDANDQRGTVTVAVIVIP